MTLEEFNKECTNLREYNFVRCDRGCVEIYSADNENDLLHIVNDCLCANYADIRDAYAHLSEYQAFFEIFSQKDLRDFLKDYNDTHDNVDIDVTLID